MRVAIAGGGIGGITAALCLAKQGFECTVFEQADAFTEAGAGIQLSPNCSRVLHHVGLEGALQDRAFKPQATRFRHWRSGQVITESALGDTAAEHYGAPYYHVHRGDLLDMLLIAARSQDLIQLNTQAQLSSVEPHPDHAEFSVGGERRQADVLVGADGIHSTVRANLWGEQQPRFTGNVAWRALVPVERLPQSLQDPVGSVWWGPGRHFVHYFVRGGTFMNCVCVVEKTGWQVESWTERGDKAELEADFAGWHDDIAALIDAADADSLYKWALFDRPPMSQWGRGRVTLLGDACHPTLPFMAQGAAMAIEDAAVLASALKGSDDVAHALSRYEAARKARTAFVQNGSRRNAKVFHLSGIKAWLRNRAAGRAGGSTFAKLYRYDPFQALNA